MIGHLSADELADFRAGIVNDSRAARISAHLSSCARCAGVDADLAGVSVMLASIALPPMPARLSERVQAAISNEAASRAAGQVPIGQTDGIGIAEPVPVGVPGRPDLPERAPRRAWRPRLLDWSSPLVLRGLAATGVLALVVGGGLLLANGNGATPTGVSARPASGSVRRPTAIGNRAAHSTKATVVRYQQNGHYLTTTALASDADYTRSNLPKGVRRAVAGVATIYPSATSGPTSPDVSEPAPSAGPNEAPASEIGGIKISRLAGCLAAAAAGHAILLAEVAHYRHMPATLIVLQPMSGAFSVIVVGQACTSSSPDIITRLSVPSK